jgi:hypothetical protein
MHGLPIGVDSFAVQSQAGSGEFKWQRRLFYVLFLPASVVRVGSQSLRYTGKGSDVFLRIAPRPPEAQDLHALDGDCPIDEKVSPKPLKRVLVAVKGGYMETRELTEWVCTSLKHSVSWCEPQAVCSDPGVLET